MKAIISGASRGIGRAVAQKLAAEGFDLLLLSRTEIDTQEIVRESGKEIQVESIQIDLSKTEEIQQIKIDQSGEDQLILVNNVGQYFMDFPVEIQSNELRKLLEINLFSHLELVNQLDEKLQNSERSHIFNIGSIDGIAADHRESSYSISKHAFQAWTQVLREEKRKEGIKVTSFIPGPVTTSSWDGVDVDRNQMIQAEDIANLIYSISQLSSGSLVEEVVIQPMNFKIN